MTISHEKKLIFINVPKNAGTSIIRAMGVENVFIDKTIEEYKAHYQDYWSEYKKFTVVRDPIDRFISAYKFARMKESFWFSATEREGLEKHEHFELCTKMNINQYVSHLYEDQDRFNIWVFPQTHFIIPQNGSGEIDYYVRYENLLEDLHKIGINNIEKINTSKIDNEIEIKLTKRSKYMLYEIYDVDYKNFSYIKGTKPSLFYQ